MTRLTLNKAARVSPVQIDSSVTERPQQPPARRAQGTQQKKKGGSPKNAPRTVEMRNSDSPRRVPKRQIAVWFDLDTDASLDELVTTSGGEITSTALVTSTLIRGLPTDGIQATQLISEDLTRKLRNPNKQQIERNIRLPLDLSTQLQQLTVAAKQQIPAANRSALIRAILFNHLPKDPKDAAQQVINYRIDTITRTA